MNYSMTPLCGLANVNVELTSRCNKNCWCCGRRKIDREYPEIAMDYGDMDFSLVEKIAAQLPPGIIVQLHNNGEPLLYHRLGDALRLFYQQITSLDTNGKLLVERADELIDNIDTIAISIVENDPERDEQFAVIRKFLKMKEGMPPLVILRLNGNVEAGELVKEFPNLLTTSRSLHSPMGSFEYKKQPIKPEHGICLEMLQHLSIDRKGRVSPCVRFDPTGLNVIGDANNQSLAEIWNSSSRLNRLDLHVTGCRDFIPLCKQCEYWGIPTGAN